MTTLTVFGLLVFFVVVAMLGFFCNIKYSSSLKRLHSHQVNLKRFFHSFVLFLALTTGDQCVWPCIYHFLKFCYRCFRTVTRAQRLWMTFTLRSSLWSFSSHLNLCVFFNSFDLHNLFPIGICQTLLLYI